MSSKHKPSRKERREQGLPKPIKAPRAVADPMRRPVIDPAVPAPSSATSSAATPPAAVTATFAQPNAERDAGGIVTELAALEYPAIRRDLKKLGFTIFGFILILAALTIIDQQTTIIHDFGHQIYGFAK